MTTHQHRDRAHHHPTQIRGAASAITHGRGPAVAATALLLTSAAALPASARQDPGPASGYTATTPTQPQTCPLTRLGTQLVRCDNLTGAGAPAPLWVPAWSPGVGSRSGG
jgi:hypothetical protein